MYNVHAHICEELIQFVNINSLMLSIIYSIAYILFAPIITFDQ